MKIDFLASGFAFPGTTIYNDGKGDLTVTLTSFAFTVTNSDKKVLEHNLFVGEDLVITYGVTTLIKDTDYILVDENYEASDFVTRYRNDSNTYHVYSGIKILNATYHNVGLVAVGTYSGDQITARDYNNLGSGGGGSQYLNYITEGNFENGLGRFVTYADVAGIIPVDGTDGTSNLVLSITTLANEILIGAASAKLVKDAANRQGQGISCNFTIDNQEVNTEMQIGCNFNASSGYTTADMKVFIYDVDNSSFIPVAGQDIPAGRSKLLCTFNTSNSLNYRLIFHVASTSSTAYNLFIDDISVSPKQNVLVNPSGFYKTYTPTVTTGTGTMTNYTCSADAYQLGDLIKVKGAIKFSGAGGTWDGLYISLPAGLTINTNKISSDTATPLSGNATFQDVSVSWIGSGIIIYYSATQIRLLRQTSATGEQADVSGTAPTTWASGDTIGFDFSLPIAQWESPITLVSGYEEFAYNTSATDADDTSSYQFGPEGAVGVIRTTALTTFRKKRIKWKNAILPTDVTTIEIWDGYSWRSFEQVPIYYDGISYYTIPTLTNYSTGASEADSVGIGLVTVNAYTMDVIFGAKAIANYNSGAGVWNATQIIVGTKWRVRKSSSYKPSEIAPLVRAKYTNSAAATTDNPINYQTKVEDTHSVVTIGAAWKATAPISGVYSITGTMVSTATSAADVRIFKNGVALHSLAGCRNEVLRIGYAVELRLYAGDYVDIRPNQSGGSTANSTDYISITRIGS